MKLNRRTAATAATMLACSTLLFACGGGGDSDVTTTPPAATTVTISGDLYIADVELGNEIISGSGKAFIKALSVTMDRCHLAWKENV